MESGQNGLDCGLNQTDPPVWQIPNPVWGPPSPRLSVCNGFCQSRLALLSQDESITRTDHVVSDNKLARTPAHSQRAKVSERPAADLDEVVRLYGLRVWVEQSYKQVKGALGWAQYQVRSDLAIRRHWQLVCCAFSFCWWALCREKPMAADLAVDIPERPAQVEAAAPLQDLLEETDPRGKKPWPNRATPTQLAGGVTKSSGLAGTVSDATALLASVVQQAPTSTLTSIA